MNDHPSPPVPESSVAVGPVRSSWWRTLLWSLLVAVVLVAAGYGLHRLVLSQQTAGMAGGPGGGRGGGRMGGGGPAPVDTAPVRMGTIPIILNALGTVTPLATVTVRSQIAGQLTALGFTEGQLVTAGDFLAQVDPRPYELSLAQYQGQLQRDQALATDAELDLQRYQRLVAEDSIAKQQYDTQAALVEQYKGTVATDQALINTAKLNIQYCHIVAPITGRVGIRQVDVGNYVTVGDANGLVVITQLQPISVLFSLAEDYLPSVLERLRAHAQLTASAWDRSKSTKLADGVLVTVDNQIDVSTGQVRLRAQFTNDDSALFPNQFVNVQLLVNLLRQVLVIPSSAVQRGAPGTFVFVVNADNTVSLRTIVLGASAGERVQVLSGLKPDEVVVTGGADKLRDHSPVAPGSAGGPAGSGGHGAGQGGAGKSWAHQHSPGTAAASPDAAATPSADTSQAPPAADHPHHHHSRPASDATAADASGGAGDTWPSHASTPVPAPMTAPAVENRAPEAPAAPRHDP